MQNFYFQSYFKLIDFSSFERRSREREEKVLGLHQAGVCQRISGTK
jgi:hypothetical protein